MQVGLLLPNSNYIPRLASDVRRCFSDGLVDAGLSEHGISVETTAYNASAREVGDGVRQLVIRDEVDVVVAPLNPGLVGAMEPVMRGQQTPLLTLTMGEDVCVGDLAPPWVLCNSFDLWRSAWLTGWWAAATYGPRACNISAAHEGGYGLNFAFGLGVEAAGGTVVASFPGSLELDAAEANEKVAAAAEIGADFVMLLASGNHLALLTEACDKTESLAPVVALAPFAYGGASAPDGATAMPGPSISCWNPGTPANTSFIERFVAETKRPAHAYAVLAYEAGLLLAAAAGDGAPRGEALASALGSVRCDGPRGPAAFGTDGQEVNTAQHLLRAAPGADGAGLTGDVLDPPPLLAEQIALARRNIDKAGWTNPYLIG